ncbi:MAG: flagellar basal body-associated FliL family protein [Alphaproteobacteria bacterium]|nr:flagellar basal body-associated FliL family protein [Alphaproteobacteria bacterium]
MAEDKKKEAEEEGKEKDEGAEASADGASSENAGANAAKAKKKKMMIIAGAAVGALVLVGGVGAVMMKGGGEGETETAEKKEGNEKPAYFPLGDMIVNLSGEGKRPNYLKVKVTLELADEKDESLMELIKPRIIDNFQVYLRELRIEDLRGSAGMYRLREELLMRVTEAAQPIRIRDVLFQEMLVQ